MLPGVAHKIVKIVGEETATKVIACGLIDEDREVQEAIDSGASYVTTSNRALW